MFYPILYPTGRPTFFWRIIPFIFLLFQEGNSVIHLVLLELDGDADLCEPLLQVGADTRVCNNVSCNAYKLPIDNSAVVKPFSLVVSEW